MVINIASGQPRKPHFGAYSTIPGRHSQLCWFRSRGGCNGRQVQGIQNWTKRIRDIYPSRRAGRESAQSSQPPVVHAFTCSIALTRLSPGPWAFAHRCLQGCAHTDRPADQSTSAGPTRLLSVMCVRYRDPSNVVVEMNGSGMSSFRPRTSGIGYACRRRTAARAIEQRPRVSLFRYWLTTKISTSARAFASAACTGSWKFNLRVHPYVVVVFPFDPLPQNWRVRGEQFPGGHPHLLPGNVVWKAMYPASTDAL